MFNRGKPQIASLYSCHIHAKWTLLVNLSKKGDQLERHITSWNSSYVKDIKEPRWSDDQRDALKAISDALQPEDCWMAETAKKPIYLGGDPGTGKSEVLVHAAIEAAENGCTVLLMCPTGTLVHAYRERLPNHRNIVIETIHSAMVIIRENDAVVMYAPPSRLRKFDLFLIDEASQIENEIAIRLRMAMAELRHHHVLVVAADYRQLQPIAGGGEMIRWCLTMTQFHLTEVHRTGDKELLEFLNIIRKDQPTRFYLHQFWQGRHLSSDLGFAMQQAKLLAAKRNKHFMWLCVTNKGADTINHKALEQDGVTEAELASGYPGDSNAAAGTMYIKPGLWIRLSRNLDKQRGFVNGALAQVYIHYLGSVGDYVMKTRNTQPPVHSPPSNTLVPI